VKILTEAVVAAETLTTSIEAQIVTAVMASKMSSGTSTPAVLTRLD